MKQQKLIFKNNLFPKEKGISSCWELFLFIINSFYSYSQDLNSVFLQAHHGHLKTRSRFNILGATFSNETISYQNGVSKLNTRL